MVYAADVKGKRLTFVVSGKLWNRSLIMQDQETKSDWSHILGVCVDGDLKGTELEALPADMLTWDGWRQEHPKTTVLNLRRSSKGYQKEFYRNPKEFVLGFTGGKGEQHISFAALLKEPVQNMDAQGLPLLVVFDRDSTSGRLFQRVLGDRVLTFKVGDKPGTLTDAQTGSTWNRRGQAIDGEFKGRQLKAHVGIPSYAKAWKKFHPDSVEP